MSFGGFGNNNNNNTNAGFGGFGNNNTTNTTSGASLFGGNTATSGGFSGFGGNNAAATNNSPFGGGGAKTGFGSTPASTGSGLFGGGSTGGFGANNNATSGATLSTGFGASNSGSLFGAKPATGGFGGTTNTSGSLFGNSSTGGFGASNNTATANPFSATSNTTANPFGGASGSTATGGFGANNNSSTGFGGFGNNAAGNTTQGTAATPFTAVTEKDGGATNTSSAYQSITMQQPYQGKSFDELRYEDYAQNRRLPQNNSFGSSSTFGGFGANNNAATNNNTNATARPGLFGASSTPGAFGNNTNASTGFGATNTGFGANNNAGAGVFGAKPATTGLFGSNNTTTTTTGGFGAASNTGGGLFGSNNNTAANTTAGFGGFGNTNNNNTTSSLFGGGANAASTENKPGFGGFGASNTTSTNTGFGGFGNNAASSNTAATGGLFGGNAATGGFGSNTGTGLFGAANNQNKPAGTGLFGAAAAPNTAGTGLFGAANNTSTGAFGASTGGGLFGNNNQATNNTGGGLFGANNQNKPAGTGLFGSAPAANNSTGLFGGANQNTAGSSLFGNNQNNAGSSLFGNLQNKPAGSLFGANNAGGSSLFGNNNAAAGSSLFGGNNNQNQGNSLFGAQNNANSLFGNGQNQPQQNQLTASITGDPYGNAQLFASLAAPSPPVGPLATPLSGARPAPKARASLLASVRGGSPMLGASTSLTPRARPGYGFSYSNYNSPVANTPLTPGATSLLRPTGSLGSALSSRLSKSFSTSNLRGDIAEGQSLVRTPAPGQGSLLLGSGSLGSGNIRRLKIDRSLRTDLFGDPPKKAAEPAKEADKEPELRKRVSFDKSAEKDVGSSSARPTPNNALVVRDESSAAPKQPEMSQTNNPSSLTTVPEESATADKSAAPSPRRPVEAGEYFTEPPLKQIKNMSRGQLSHVKSFTVGRQGVGKIEFGRTGEIDLSSVPLDDICGKIVQLKPRSATVYEDDTDKPPVGRGLNVPSTIYLEQSWPRATRHSSAAPQKSTPKDTDRHKARLRRVGGTKFLDYDDSTGIWSFTVDHFTTYELDDEDETTMQDTTSMLEAAPQSPANGESADPHIADMTQSSSDSGRRELDSPDLGEQDDTFQFKLAKRSQQSDLSLPGGFDDSMANLPHDHDEGSADEMQEDEFVQAGVLGDAAMSDPFMDIAGAVQPPSPDTLARYRQSVDEQQIDEDEDEMDIPGSFHADPDALKSILKQSTFEESLFGYADHLADLPWEDQLQRTLSPKKRDRQALRDAQGSYMDKADEPDTLLRKSLLSRSQLGQSYLATKSTKSAQKKTSGHGTDNQHTEAFRTSMDIMRSLWADDKQASSRGKLSSRILKSTSRASETNAESEFHQSFKPTFTNHDTLVFAGRAGKTSSNSTAPLKPIAGHSRDVKFYHAQSDEDINAPALREIQQSAQGTSIEAVEMDADDQDNEGMPMAFTSNAITFASLADSVSGSSAAAEHERTVWKLCSVLFDDLEICAFPLLGGMSTKTVDDYHHQLRKDAFLSMWTEMLKPTLEKQLQRAKTAEERALYLLCSGDILAASETLMEAKNSKLAILVAQLPGSEPNREIIQEQINAWQQRKDWSEFSAGQRALYTVLSGKTCIVSGVKGAPEDRVDEFCLSTEFGLTWQQSLALKIRYSAEEGLQYALKAYVADLADGIELVKPAPWHGHADNSDDTLLSLLKIITEQATPESIFDATVVSGNAFHHRLTWQLASLFRARHIMQPDDAHMDALTIDFASEQESAGSYLNALWTLLHLEDNEARHTAIKAVLERNGGIIPDPAGENDRGDFEVIVEDLLIPASAVWHAKAQSTAHDDVLQCQYLLYAGTRDGFQEAHKVLCQKIGPTAVIEQHYDDVIALVQQFEDIGSVHFDDWATGGQVYLLLSQLVSLSDSRSRGREAESILKKLNRALEAQQEESDRGLSLEMRVARIEMRKLVNTKAKQLENTDSWLASHGQDVAKSNKGGELLLQYMAALGVVR